MSCYPTILVASKFVTWVAWKRLPPELRAQVKAKRHPQGTFLTALGPAGWPWVQEQAQRWGVREWRRGAWRVVKGNSLILTIGVPGGRR